MLPFRTASENNQLGGSHAPASQELTNDVQPLETDRNRRHRLFADRSIQRLALVARHRADRNRGALYRGRDRRVRRLRVSLRLLNDRASFCDEPAGLSRRSLPLKDKTAGIQ